MINLGLLSQFLVEAFKSYFHIFQDVDLLLVNDLSDWIKNLSHIIVGLFESFNELSLEMKIFFGFLLDKFEMSFDFLGFGFEWIELHLKSFGYWVHFVIFMAVLKDALNANENFLIGAKGCVKKVIPSYFLECLKQCLVLEFLSLIRAKFLGKFETLSMKVDVLHWIH